MEKAGLCHVITMAATFQIRIYIHPLPHREMSAFGCFHRSLYNFELGNSLNTMPTFAPGEAEPQIYNMTCSWPLNHEWQVALEPQFSAPEASFPPIQYFPSICILLLTW